MNDRSPEDYIQYLRDRSFDQDIAEAIRTSVRLSLGVRVRDDSNYGYSDPCFLPRKSLDFTPVQPTPNACWENSRRQGGSRQHLYELHEDLSGRSKFKDFEVLGCGSSTVSRLRKIYERELEEFESPKFLDVEYQLIPEPGKFRGITKGPAGAYSALRPLQRYLLTRWATLSCSTMSDEALEKMSWNLTEKVVSGTLYSTDYDAATDYIDQKATLIAWEETAKILGIWRNSKLWNCAVSSLVLNRISYSFSPVLATTPLVVKRGQLMGSPLSFFFLCVLNLATQLYAFEINSRVEILESPFMVNGDDVAFRGTEDNYARFKHCADEIGFVVNPLKTFASRKWVMMNSKLYRSDSVRSDYLRFSLAKGYRVKTEPLSTVGSAAAIYELLGECPEGSDRLRSIFLSRLNNQTEAITVNGNKFRPCFAFPKCLGGFGVPIEYSKVHPTLEQRRLATFLMRNPKSVLTERAGKLEVVASRLSMRAALKMFPSVESNLHEGRPVEGPAPLNEDIDSIADSLIHVCMSEYKLVPGYTEFSSDYAFKWLVRSFSCEEQPMKKRKILSFNRHLRVCRNLELPVNVFKPWLSAFPYDRLSPMARGFARLFGRWTV
jgi:hypothetical protein